MGTPQISGRGEPAGRQTGWPAGRLAGCLADTSVNHTCVLGTVIQGVPGNIFRFFCVKHGVLAYWIRVSFTHIDSLCNTMCVGVVSKTPSEAHARVNKRLAFQV